MCVHTCAHAPILICIPTRAYTLYTHEKTTTVTKKFKQLEGLISPPYSFISTFFLPHSFSYWYSHEMSPGFQERTVSPPSIKRIKGKKSKISYFSMFSLQQKCTHTRTHTFTPPHTLTHTGVGGEADTER